MRPVHYPPEKYSELMNIVLKLWIKKIIAQSESSWYVIEMWKEEAYKYVFWLSYWHNLEMMSSIAQKRLGHMWICINITQDWARSSFVIISFILFRISPYNYWGENYLYREMSGCLFFRLLTQKAVILKSHTYTCM